MSYVPDNAGEMHLVPEPIFTVTTNGIGITTITNTSSSGIFLGESSWFEKRCKKINHAESPLSFLVPSFVTMALSEEDAIIQISVDDSHHYYLKIFWTRDIVLTEVMLSTNLHYYNCQDLSNLARIRRDHIANTDRFERRTFDKDGE
ncbi:hypothetical protein PUN28_014327 [Cardiocondyla obscurior]|uniref:Nucleoporin Nup133/Nup155-like N-terminal domain-containing protein n=1 Tax=Cardiocondyla obscurior TaxID=286306 RepID=A0AAW2F2S9_9HYME